VGFVVLIGCGLVAAATEAQQATREPHYVYKTSQVLLNVSKPIVLTIREQVTENNHNVLKVLGSVKLPTDPKKFTADGVSKNETSGKLVTNTLTITYNAPIQLENSTEQLTDVKLKIVTTLHQNVSYWKISAITVSYKGKFEANDESLWVDKVPGFLPKEYASWNWNCARDFTSCAPMALSWTCDQQTFTSKELDNSGGKGTVLVFPGMELQPLYGGARIRFGFNWDCDPLITPVLWVTLLLGLALIVALYWSCDMITSLTTPDRFDDAKKTKPIMVNQAE